jgi:hypothetical protein
MSNIVQENEISFDVWLNSYPEKVRGFMSVYNDEPFDYDRGTPAYELGRQLALLAKLDGLRRSDLVRKRPKIEAYAFTKTKIHLVEQIAVLAGFWQRVSEDRVFGVG